MMDNPAAPSVPADAEATDSVLAPREGWVALLGLLGAMLAVAFAVDDAGWAGQIRGSRDVNQTHFLPLATGLSVLIGFVLAKSRLSRLANHFLGALVGAAFMLVAVSSVISTAPSLEGRLHALNLSLGRFYHDAFELGIRSSETTVFLLMIGTLLWAAGQFAAFAVFRYRRSLPALIVPGAILLANMSVTIRPQYGHLIVFTAAALVLAVRLNLSGQREGWRERRIVDGGQLSGLFMRSGAMFVAVTVLGSILLAANASSAPLARAWRDADQRLLEVGIEINRWIGGVSGPARGPANFFTSSQTISEFWQSSNEQVFTVTTNDGEGYYWRRGTFSLFDGIGWNQVDRVTRRVEAGDDLLSGSADTVADPSTRHEVRLTVVNVGLGGNAIVAPETPVDVNRPVDLATHGDTGPFYVASIDGDLFEGDQFTVTSLVPLEAGPKAVTENQLAAARTTYPSWIDPYLQVPDSIGPLAEQEAASVVAGLSADQRDPYHVAEAIQDYLHSDGGFVYNTDMRGICAGETKVDCLLRARIGFCEYFASTMAMMLRTQGIPTRYVTGYLPGTQFAEFSWRVDASASHAWVEVYFPGYGWIKFDPTPPGNAANGQVRTDLEPGGPIAPVPSRGPDFGRGEQECEDGVICSDDQGVVAAPTPQVGVGPTAPRPPDLLAPIVLGLLIVALLVLLVVAAMRRVPQVQPEQAYRGMERIARRFGHGARPSQTVYEYAGDLAELLPRVRNELQVVATAKVQATYAPSGADSEILESMRRAYRRVRIALVRLLMRRPRLGRSPRVLGPKQ